MCILRVVQSHIVTNDVIVVSVLNYKPCHKPLQHRCPMKSDHVRPPANLHLYTLA